jgi:ribonuclease BN (tRNA processing enzyme)
VSEVIFVGTSDAFGAGGRRQSATLVRGPSGGLLFDCGGTTLSGLNELGIERGEIDTIVLSHFHADHFGGVPSMLIAMLYEDQRDEMLRIAGPPELEPRVRAACEALGHPLDDRLWRFKTEFTVLEPGRPTTLGPVGVVGFQTHHNPEANPQGYVVTVGSRRVAYSGDTGWFEALPEMVAGADLFVCECTQLTPGYEYHLSLEELVERQDQFDVKDMILTHLGTEMAKQRGECALPTADDGLIVRV